MVNILLVLTNHGIMGTLGKETGWYLPEVAHPYHVFHENGYNITFVSAKGGNAPMDPGSGTAFAGDQICKEFLDNADIMKQIKNTKSIADVSPKDFQVIFFAGGHGPMFDLAQCEATNKAAADIYENGGVVAAVCHGPAGIVNTKLSNGEYLVKGRTVTAFTNSEEDEMQLSEYMPFMLETDLRKHGAIFKPADNWKECVHSDQRVVTGQNPASATACAQAVVNALK